MRPDPRSKEVCWLHASGIRKRWKHSAARRLGCRCRSTPRRSLNYIGGWAMRQTASFHLSHGIQLQDAMIASVAARLAVPLYTTNLKHFQPLPSVDANTLLLRMARTSKPCA